jgi:hypothetical protein
MPTLTRRKSTERHECWYIYYDGVQVGAIARRAGAPADSNPWGWSCGFYPGMEPGEHQDDTAASIDAARVEIDEAWQRVLPRLSDDALQEWRDQQATTCNMRCTIAACRYRRKWPTATRDVSAGSRSRSATFTSTF